MDEVGKEIAQTLQVSGISESRMAVAEVNGDLGPIERKKSSAMMRRKSTQGRRTSGEDSKPPDTAEYREILQ